jgi:hypothetical protein
MDPRLLGSKVLNQRTHHYQETAAKHEELLASRESKHKEALYQWEMPNRKSNGRGLTA